jgi:hypothetical protein
MIEPNGNAMTKKIDQRTFEYHLLVSRFMQHHNIPMKMPRIASAVAAPTARAAAPNIVESLIAVSHPAAYEAQKRKVNPTSAAMEKTRKRRPAVVETIQSRLALSRPNNITVSKRALI